MTTELMVTSKRSLSVSFQGEAFYLPISKTKLFLTDTKIKPPWLKASIVIFSLYNLHCYSSRNHFLLQR
ncbi:hypothetical protein L1887_20219 [Cichorium endivia]|nr:hypothetical protein L1887_20219 [Cichorium endivia]